MPDLTVINNIVKTAETLQGLTVSSLMSALARVASADPERVAEKVDGVCVYQNNGEPSCIIGRVLFRLGVSTDTLAMCERNGAKHVFVAFGVTDKNVLGLANMAQGLQDDGMKWGDVHRSVRQAYTNLILG